MQPILGYILNSELNVPYCGQSLDPVLTFKTLYRRFWMKKMKCNSYGGCEAEERKICYSIFQ